MTLEPVRFLFSENINVYLQSLGNPIIDFLFRAITNLGSQPVYFLLASLVFWCYGKKTGIRLMYVILFSAFISIFAKNLFGMARPPDSLHKVEANGFGFPSGHAQVSASFWVYLRGRINNQWLLFAGAVAILLISLSRVYLGVHYVGDVIGGVLFGTLVALSSIKAEASVINKLQKLSSRSKYFIAIILPLILMAIAFSQHGLLGEQVEIELIMMSAGVGYILEEEHLRFEDAKNNRQRAIRAFIGITLLSAIYLIYFSISSLILIDSILIFFKYAASGLITTIIVPLVFSKIESSHFIKCFS